MNALVVEWLLDDLRNAHDRYLDQLGRQTADLERLGERLGCLDDMEVHLRSLRETRAAQEQHLREMEATYRAALT